MDNGIEIHVDWGDDFRQHLEVFILTRDSDNHAHRVMIVEEPETMGEIAMYRPPVGHMSRNAAQWLMNRLWEMDFRPTGDATPGQLKAMQAHLKDMQDQNSLMLGVLVEYFRKRV